MSWQTVLQRHIAKTEAKTHQHVRGSGSVYPSTAGSRGSAQGFLDVSNLCTPGTEEKDEEDVLSVPCMARDIA